MKEGLGYTLSAVTYAIPKEGFEYMRQLADSQDESIIWILERILKKPANQELSG